jgi:mRNA-degrading endonuclease HigB of HigAB toxin-antitoxin module
MEINGQAAIDAAVAAAVAAATMGLPKYVNNGEWLTRADLKANFPASNDQLGKLARVLDVWGTVRTTLICEYDGTMYYWRPQRTDYAVGTPQNTGNIALIPLVTAPAIIMKSNLLGAVNLQLSTTDVWPGCTFDITAPSIIGLNLLQFTGLIGGLTSALLGGSRKVARYDSDGWRIVS